MSYKKMNPNWKERWIAALRGGKYGQAIGVMKNRNGGFCCLGVLQDLVEPENGDGRVDASGIDMGVPTVSCLKTAGLGRYRVGEGKGGIVGKLIEMNDEERRTFDEIADFIEENL